MTTGRRRAASSGEDELLALLYQQLTEAQVARSAAGYGLAAGLGRYRAWLAEHTAREEARPQAVPAARPAALRAALAGSGAGIAAAVTGGPVVLRQAPPGSAGTGSGTLAAGAGWDAEQAVTALYSAHYRSLVRLAALLVRDTATAEEVVQDSFIGLHASWRRVADTEKALSYLRQSVVNLSRKALRYGGRAGKPAPDMPSAEQAALPLLERSAVLAALRELPARQREALVLRYYGGLSEAQIASAMGISKGAVKSHTARAIAALRAVLEME